MRTPPYVGSDYSDCITLKSYFLGVSSHHRCSLSCVQTPTPHTDTPPLPHFTPHLCPADGGTPPFAFWTWGRVLRTSAFAIRRKRKTLFVQSPSAGNVHPETGERNFTPASPSDTRAHVQRGTSIQKTTALLLSEWAAAVLGYPDSNQKKQDQNLLCCQLHHTPNFQVFASAPLLFASAKVAPSCKSARLPPFFLSKPLKKCFSTGFHG